MKILICFLLIGCTVTPSKTISTKGLQANINNAQSSINQAIDSKDEIKRLLKERDQYDDKESKLIEQL